jgi:hypothetical protein
MQLTPNEPAGERSHSLDQFSQHWRGARTARQQSESSGIGYRCYQRRRRDEAHARRDEWKIETVAVCQLRIHDYTCSLSSDDSRQLRNCNKYGRRHGNAAGQF